MKKLIVKKELDRSLKFKDPLMNCLDNFIEEIQHDQFRPLFEDLNEVFYFLDNRIVEYLKYNRWYKKPSSLRITYCKPSCCPATIRISYLNESITVSQPIKNETDPIKINNDFGSL